MRFSRTRRLAVGAVLVLLAVAAIVAARSRNGPGLEARDLPTALPRPAVTLARQPRALAVGRDEIWVTAAALPGGSYGRLTRLETRTLQVAGSRRVGALPQAVALTAGAVWVANAHDGRRAANLGDAVLRINASTASRTARIAVPGVVDLAAGIGRLWVVSTSDQRSALQVLNLMSHRLMPATTFRGIADDESIAFGAGSVWVLTTVFDPLRGTSSRVTRVDARSRKVVARISLPGVAHGLAFGAQALWIPTTVVDGGRTHGELLVVHPDTGRLERGHARFDGIGSVAVQGRSVWVAVGTTSVARVDARSRRVLQTLRVGRSNGTIAAGAGAVWSSDLLGNRVVRLTP